MGAGTLIDARKRYVLTNYHVVDGVDSVYVQFPVRQKDGTLVTDRKAYIERIPAGQALKGKVLYRDKTRDLALVQLDRLPPNTAAIPLARKSPRPGETVINIGNPGKVETTFSTTRGEVRGVGVVDMVVGGGDEVLRIKARMVSVTNPINPGDSGGPIINSRGYQVAVTESGWSGAAAQNVNSCVDVTEVRGFLDEKKIVLSTDSPAPDKGPKPKVGPDSTKPKIDAPPDRTHPQGGPPVAPKADPSADPGTPAAASPEDEKAAAMMLHSANLFKDDDDKAYYKSKLKAIVDKYPATAAGKEAKKRLDALK